MIGTGWFAWQPRTIGGTIVRRRTPPYTRRRRIARRRLPKAAHRPFAGDTGDMLFDQVRELPVATVRRAPRSTLGRLGGDLVRWLATRWSWIRPRAIPLAVAALGMFAVIGAAGYLRDIAHAGWDPPERLRPAAAAPEVATITVHAEPTCPLGGPRGEPVVVLDGADQPIATLDLPPGVYTLRPAD